MSGDKLMCAGAIFCVLVFTIAYYWPGPKGGSR